MTVPPIPVVKPVPPPAPTAPVPITPVTPAPVPSPTVKPVSPTPIAPVATPSPTLSPVAPTGTLTPVASCCPKAAHFTASSTVSDYFGFDDKTNLVSTVGVDEYWLPPTKAKSLPSNRETRDGAAWMSVEEGKTAKAKINFAGHSGVGCISNVTFKPDTPAHVSVVSSTVAGAVAVFEIKGGTEGECSVEVVCSGKTVGYIHVACYKPQAFRVAICNINQPAPPPPPPPTPPAGAAAPTTPATPPPPALNLPVPAMSLSGYQSFFDEVYKQAVAPITLSSLAGYNLPATPSVLGGNFFDAGNSMGYNHFVANYGSIRAQTDAIHAAVSARDPGYDYYLYLMPMPNLTPPPPETSRLNGYVNTISGTYGIFFNAGPGLTSTAAHEFGHLLGLRHPNDTAGASQYPTHLQATTAAEIRANTSVNDTLNLMGYGHPRPARKALRLKQWKSIPNR
ncbi:hypothetical protein BCF46_3513 [Litoreibacter meonggei]|uniref:Uncharacterized protein n=1 Tax=Litoreibacter meonggei TaxID=1049199 RepID=A0A497VCD6_9RHOB|nr:hypothetical protein [Litoreibacter meonggei]RLJ40942.1 hypothetical protein BCF46_3513 [Litoreibacter meonggei]